MTNILKALNISLIVINILICLVSSLVVLLTPNLKVFIITHEISNVFLLFFFVILFLICALLPLIPFIQHKFIINLLSMTGLVILMITSFYSCYQLFQWFSVTLDGTLNIKFMTFIKEASYEERIVYYHQSVKDTLAILASKSNPELMAYLQKSPIIKEPPSYELAKITLKEIPSLVNKNIQEATAQYQEIQNLQLIPKRTWPLGKIIFWGFTSIVVLGTIYYFLNSNDKLASIVQTGLTNTSKMGTNLIADEKDWAIASKTLAQLSRNVGTVAEEVRDLKIIVASQSETILLLKRTVIFLVKTGLRDPLKALATLKTNSYLVDIKQFIEEISDSII